MTSGTIHLGTSGWVYAHWRGLLYERGLSEKHWLARYAKAFSTVEINSSFYHLVARETFARWRKETPRDSLFAVKGSRYLTHMKRLLDVGQGLRNFLSPLRGLGSKVGPILWQLPPRFRVDLARLDETCDVPDHHGAAFCEHDLVDRAPPRLTGGFPYLRFHGRTGKYGGRYGRAALRRWARDLDRWRARGCDAWVYFRNDTAGHALHDARDLGALLGIDVRLDLP